MKDVRGCILFPSTKRRSRLWNYRVLHAPRDRSSIRSEDKLRNRVRDSYTGSTKGVARKRHAEEAHTPSRIHSAGETWVKKRNARRSRRARRRKRGMAAGGKPIDSRNTLGHGLLPHPLPPSHPPPASGFYLLDTHQSRISAWSGLRMKLMWGRASRVWEARTLRTSTSVWPDRQSISDLKKRGREKSDTGGCRLRRLRPYDAKRIVA